MHSSTITKTPVDLGFKWWQVLGSNQRRLSRRFYIPEGAGRGQGAVVPVFGAFPGRVWACREEGRGPGGAPGWTNDLEAGPSPGSHWTRPGTAMGYVGWRAPCAVRVLGRLAAAFIPSGVPAAGWPRGHGAGSRAGSGINQTARPRRRGRGPVKPAITRCPRPGLLTRPSAAAAARDADLAVAHRVEDPGEQLAGRGDLGDVAGLLAAAGDDVVLALAQRVAGGHVLDRLDQRPAQQPRALLGDVPAADLGVGLAVPRGQPGPASTAGPGAGTG